MSAEAAPAEAATAVMSPVEKAARVGAWFVALVGISLWSEVVGNVWCIWLTRRRSQARVRRSNALVKMWGGSLFDLVVDWMQARLVLTGSVPEGRFVVVSNHQSTADIAILIRALAPLNCKFVAKRGLGWGLPAVSVALARAGGALISRHASRRDVRGLERMAHDLEHWEGSAVLFAEGRRSRDGRVLPYRSGALRIVAETARLPLLPVAIDGTHVASDLRGFATGMPGTRVAMWIGEPIPVERWDGRLDEALQEIREWAARSIEEARIAGVTAPPPGWTPGSTLANDPIREA